MSERWLIAVNGKTEAIYINALRQLFRSSAVEVKHFANDPFSQVIDAERFAKRKATKFRRIYVVFDTDHFECVPKALAKIKELNELAASKPKKPSCEWIPIINSPCFELWHYLHFDYTCAAFGGLTPCRDLQNQFSKAFGGYSKVDAKTAKDLVETKLDTACKNAVKLSAHASSSKTDMWKLAEALRDRQKGYS